MISRPRAVEVAGGLVGEQQRRAGDDRARDRDALLLAARELARACGLPAREADGASASRASSAALARSAAAVDERQLDVLERAWCGRAG